MFKITHSRRLLATLFALAAATASPGLAGAQQAAPAAAPAQSEPTATTASYGNWVLRCVRLAAAKDAAKPAEKSCEVQQAIQAQGQPQPVAQLAIGRLPGDKTLILTVVLPVDISIPGSVHLSGNGKTGADEKAGFDLTWQRCVPGGCFAAAKPDVKNLGLLKADTDGQIRFADATGRVIAVPVSWVGLDQALKALDEQS